MKQKLVFKVVPSHGAQYGDSFTISTEQFSVGDLETMLVGNLGNEDLLKFISDMTTLEINGHVVDSTKLTVGDFFFIGTMRKLGSVGSESVTLKKSCSSESCKSELEMVVNMDGGIEYSEIKLPEGCKLPLKVDIDGTPMEFRLLTIKDIIKHSPKTKTETLAASCSNMEFDEALKLIKNIPVSEADVITQIDDILDHGPKDIKVKCKDCNTLNIFDMSKGDDWLVKPFRESGKPSGYKISFS